MITLSRMGTAQPLLRMAILSSFLLFSGCAWLDQYRGEGFTGSDATWGEAFRKKGEARKERFFFDERSNQIERSLGL